MQKGAAKMRTFRKAALLASVAAFVSLPVQAQDVKDGATLIETPEIRKLGDQDVDANRALVDALRRAAARGPVFRISPKNLSLEVRTGMTSSSTIRITNSGDELGLISGINLIGSIPSLEMKTTCEEELPEGDYCEITVAYSAGSLPGSIETALVGTVNEKDRSSFEIPVAVTVIAPPAPKVEPKVVFEPVKTPEPVSITPPARDVARGYFGALGSAWGGGMGVQKGFTIVSASEGSEKTQSVAGVRYEDIRVEIVETDVRYDKDTVPFTEAGLPVDRDRILTADRVIKAVLETPVSNVMCNKVVAMVESDVYSATSDRPLIQAGSRVIGECQNFVDERTGIVWNRIITTDGRSISFRNHEAGTNDATGLGGALGRVYMSPFDRYVLPIVSTMIDTVAGVVYATFGKDETVVVDENGNTISSNTASNEGLDIVTGEARDTAQQIIKDIRDVREVVIVPKGSRIDIEILEDIYFKDSREVVRLADMRFDLDQVEAGAAERDLPSELTLVPAEAGYSGPFVVVGGRRYQVKEAQAISEPLSLPDPSPSRKVMDDIRSVPGAGEEG